MKTPNKQRGRIVFAALLFVATVVVTTAWFVALRYGGDAFTKEWRVAWAPPAGASLGPSGGNFFFDVEAQQLVYRGSIDDSEKVELANLLRIDDEAVSLTDDRGTSYRAAIDQLAYESGENQLTTTIAVLLAGGLSGSLGGMLRSVGNFVGNAAFKREGLDIPRWWPLYVMRPVEGFLLGLVIVLIVQAGFLALDAPNSPTILWWLAVSFFAGFGANDFGERLRTITKAMFGEPTRRGGDSQTGAAGRRRSGFSERPTDRSGGRVDRAYSSAPNRRSRRGLTPLPVKDRSPEVVRGLHEPRRLAQPVVIPAGPRSDVSFSEPPTSKMMPDGTHPLCVGEFSAEASCASSRDAPPACPTNTPCTARRTARASATEAPSSTLCRSRSDVGIFEPARYHAAGRSPGHHRSAGPGCSVVCGAMSHFGAKITHWRAVGGHRRRAVPRHSVVRDAMSHFRGSIPRRSRAVCGILEAP